MGSLGHGLGGIGRSVGVIIAGLVLSYFSTTALGYTATIATLAAIGLTGTTIILLFAKDPCKNNPPTSPQPISNN
jgi:amino acid transporter